MRYSIGGGGEGVVRMGWYTVIGVWRQVGEVASQELSVTVLTASAIGLASNAFYAYLYALIRRNRMDQSFLRGLMKTCSKLGHRPEKEETEDWIPHPKGEQLVENVLKEGKFTYILSGECGCGKSRLLRRALSSMNLKNLPHVYVNIRPSYASGALISQIAEGVEFHFDEKVAWVRRIVEQLLGFDPTSGRDDDPEDSEWRRLQKAVEESAARVYTQKGERPVLVIDNVQRLFSTTDDDNSTIDSIMHLTEWAAACADDRSPLRIVMAIPHGSDLRQLMRKRSRVFSRLQVCDVPRIEPQPATEWLARTVGVEPEEAERVVQRTGPLPLGLRRVVDMHDTLGMTFREIEDHMCVLGMQLMQQFGFLRGNIYCDPVRSELFSFLLALFDADVQGAPIAAPQLPRMQSACTKQTSKKSDVCSLFKLSPAVAEQVNELFDLAIITSQGGRIFLHAPPVRFMVSRFAGFPGSEDRDKFERIWSRTRTGMGARSGSMALNDDDGDDSLMGRNRSITE
eukprot:Hpha_TRINITY_DN7617_c0_g1::TRINITY_DN7617_c0_g1_i1::g.19337::m.19337